MSKRLSITDIKWMAVERTNHKGLRKKEKAVSVSGTAETSARTKKRGVIDLSPPGKENPKETDVGPRHIDIHSSIIDYGGTLIDCPRLNR